VLPPRFLFIIRNSEEAVSGQLSVVSRQLSVQGGRLAAGDDERTAIKDHALGVLLNTDD
jgi:hypothetical protein